MRQVYGRRHNLNTFLASGEVSRGEKMLSSRTDPESYITEYAQIWGNARVVTVKTKIVEGAHPRMYSGGIFRNQAGRGETWTFHSPGGGTG